MLHGTLYLQYLQEWAPIHRGARISSGSINWFMAMARRPLAGGRAGARAMVSLEPWTIPGCGYPDLLAIGRAVRGRRPSRSPASARSVHGGGRRVRAPVRAGGLRGTSTAAPRASRRSVRQRFRTARRRRRIRWRPSRIIGSTPRTSRSASSRRGCPARAGASRRRPSTGASPTSRAPGSTLAPLDSVSARVTVRPRAVAGAAGLGRPARIGRTGLRQRPALRHHARHGIGALRPTAMLAATLAWGQQRRTRSAHARRPGSRPACRWPAVTSSSGAPS